MLLFCTTAPLIDVAAKLATETGLSVGQVTWARFIGQALVMAPIAVLMGLPLRLPSDLILPVALRGLWLILSTFSFVSGLTVLPLADCLAIAFVGPFLLLFLGWAFEGDRIGPRRILASCVGFGGSLLVIQPSFAEVGPMALWPLGTALFFALYMLATRRLGGRLHPVTMQLHTSTLAILVCAPLIGMGAALGRADVALAWPLPLGWLWLGLVGVASALAHFFMTWALRLTPAGTLAPLQYLEIVSATTMGYLIWGDFPDRMSLAGIAVIVAAGLYIIQRERQAASALTQEVRPSRPAGDASAG